jgi:hypothetical protein
MGVQFAAGRARLDLPLISITTADLDVVLSCLNSPPLIYRNDSAAPRIEVRLKGKAPNTKGIGAKITVRGGAVPMQSQEIICGGRYLSSDEPVRVFAAGTLTNRLVIEVAWRSGLRSVVRDVLPNRIYEIDEASAEEVQSPKSKVQSPAPLFRDVSALLAHKHHEEPFDDFARQPLLSKKLSQLGPGVAWIDMDGDGHDELIVGSGRGGALSILRRGGNGAFAKSESVGAGVDDLHGLAGWVNSAGKRVLLAAQSSYESGSNGAVLGCTLENGRWQLTNLLSIPGSPGPLAVADINGDGLLDLFVGGRTSAGRYPEASLSLVFRSERGALKLDAENSRVLEQVGMVSAAVWSDLNGDGFPELIVACEWGPLRIFRNNRGRLTSWNPPLQAINSEPSTLNELPGWWTSVTTGDLDSDGKLDIIAGNWGLNSSYHATPEQPLILYYGDFYGDGRVNLIEAQFDPVSNKVVPRENLTLLAPTIPSLRARFRTHVSFRSASAMDVLGDRAIRPKNCARSRWLR